MSLKISELQKLTKNNKPLLDFINGIFERELLNDYDLPSVFKDYGWEFNSELGDEVLICNHDFKNDDCYDGNGWQPWLLEDTFVEFFNNDNENIRLDNGKLLLLINAEDYIYFQLFDENNHLGLDEIDLEDCWEFPSRGIYFNPIT